MGRPAFNVASLVSAFLLSLTIALWGAAFTLNPYDHHWSVTNSFHVGVGGRFDGRLFFFSDESGPYQGSIIALDGNPRLRQVGWGDAYGIYYRHFRWLDSGQTMWTLAVSLWYPTVLFSILPAAWAWCRWRRV
jgi:hypothetical protein